MDGWLKALIATACIVVIAGGGYYAWSEYQGGKIQKVAAARLACKQRLRDIGNMKTRSDDQQFLTGCMFAGHISEQELEAVRKKVLGG